MLQIGTTDLVLQTETSVSAQTQHLPQFDELSLSWLLHRCMSNFEELVAAANSPQNNMSTCNASDASIAG